MATFVLIHGAFTGGWIWGRTAKALHALGHDVHRPTLTGCGERSHLLRPEITLTMHVEDVAQMLFHEDLEGVVLVGHCYGGMIASAVAHRHGGKVAGVVHVDGVVPERGASFLDASGKGAGRMHARQNGSDWLLAPPPAESYGVKCEGIARWLSVRLQPFPRECLSTPYPYGRRDRDKPCTYLRTTIMEDPTVRAQTARAMLSGMRVEELATGPLPMVTNPGRMAKTLDSVVRRMDADIPISKTAKRGRDKPYRFDGTDR